MKKSLPVVILLVMLCRQSVFSQNACTSQRYIDTIFHSVEITDSIYFATVIPFLSDSTSPKNLYMDIYQPANDTVATRPLIVYQFGGGFVLGFDEEPDIPGFCTYFAKLGYVVATISYRLGLNPADSSSGVRAFYRATQDQRSAIRFLSQNAQQFGIDTTRIILTGTSAGCFTSFANTYMVDSNWPAAIHGLPGDTADLGCMDCSGNTDLGHHIPHLLAMINMWGAMLDTTLITVPKSIPLVSFQGTLDDLVPYTYGYPFTLPVFPKVYGGLPIHDRMSSLGILQSWHPLVGYSHEPELLAPWLNDTIYNYSRKFLYPLLLPHTSPISGDAIACTGATVTYSVVNTPGSWYCWQVTGNGNVISNTGGNSIAVAWQDTGVVSVSVTEVNDIDAPGSSESFQTTVIEHSQPAFSDSINQLHVSFNNSSVGSVGSYWNFGNNDTSTSANPVENYASPGRYTIWLYSNNGYCVDSTSQTITIDSCPIAHFTYQLTGLNAFFYGDTTNVHIYNWNYGDGDSASASSPHVFHQYQNAGSYAVVLGVENEMGCKSSDTVIVEIAKGPNAIVNLSNNNVSVICDLMNGCEVRFANQGTWMLDVYDLLGRKLVSQPVNSDYFLSTSDFQSGVYLLKLSNGNQTLVKKFVKQ